MAVLDQRAKQRDRLGLQQRLAAGHLDHAAVVPGHALEHLVERHLPPLVEGIGRVTPDTAQVAAGQAHEDARLARPGRLALDRMENLVDPQHRRTILYIGVKVTDRVTRAMTLGRPVGR